MPHEMIGNMVKFCNAQLSGVTTSGDHSQRYTSVGQRPSLLGLLLNYRAQPARSSTASGVICLSVVDDEGGEGHLPTSCSGSIRRLPFRGWGHTSGDLFSGQPPEKQRTKKKPKLVTCIFCARARRDKVQDTSSTSIFWRARKETRYISSPGLCVVASRFEKQEVT